MAKEKVQTTIYKHTHKTKDRVTRTPDNIMKNNGIWHLVQVAVFCVTPLICSFVFILSAIVIILPYKNTYWCHLNELLIHIYIVYKRHNVELNLIQPAISLEMPVPSQGHCGFPSFPVVDWFCLLVDLWVLPFPLEDCSVFGNFVITLICKNACCSLWKVIQLLCSEIKNVSDMVIWENIVNWMLCC